ncbi:Hypothetical predicted protein [Pelobates cultripes]|uniref:Uncharacterized protein n=1 Tax=Pelobates cultripes TaxID=61616 RepID=A0AAD1RUQ3_PELCU|nr:Hypothetical predicted protein [Pelobates cultripes]
MKQLIIIMLIICAVAAKIKDMEKSNAELCCCYNRCCTCRNKEDKVKTNEDLGSGDEANQESAANNTLKITSPLKTAALDVFDCMLYRIQNCA